MAYEFYMTIEGAKQGKFKGEAGRDASRVRAGKIAGIRFVTEVASPRDSAGGQASGKRAYKPILVTKEWGAASPQLFQALVSNEQIKTAVFEFVKTNANGEEYVYHRIKLTNASITGIKSYLDLTDASGDVYDAHELEDVSFVFQKIEIENLDGKTSAADNWMK
jgi:type VI secretion system secreted protein Hcp